MIQKKLYQKNLNKFHAHLIFIFYALPMLFSAYAQLNILSVMRMKKENKEH